MNLLQMELCQQVNASVAASPGTKAEDGYILKGFGFAVVVLFLGALAACGHPNAKTEKTVTPVRAATVEMYLPKGGERYSASIAPWRQAVLAFRVGGIVRELHQVRLAGGQVRSLEPGDHVSQGTVLARLRSEDYSIQVRQAESQLDAARENEQAAKAQVAQAESARAKAEADFGRARSLFESQSLTRSDFDTARSQFDATRAQVDAARAQLQAASAQARAADSALASARLAQADASLAAPFSGAVVQRNVELGMLVSPGVQAYTVADIGTVKAAFGVPDGVAVQLKRGTPVSMLVEALPERDFRGTITAIAAVADRDTRLFQVEVTLRNDEGLLRPGMIAAVSLGQTALASAVPVVPLSAIIRDRQGGSSFAVMVLEGTVARARGVTLGPTYGDRLAVTSGLQAGERVIRTGATMVADGETVEVIP